MSDTSRLNTNKLYEKPAASPGQVTTCPAERLPFDEFVGSIFYDPNCWTSSGPGVA